MDYLKYFSTNVLPQLTSTKFPNLKLRKCRCGTLFDGPHTHQINPKSNKFFCLCEKCRKAQTYYRNKNTSKVIKAKTRKLYNEQEEVKERKKEYSRKYRKQNRNKREIPEVQLRCNVSRRVYRVLNGIKVRGTMDYLECTAQELRKHLESQFNDGMTWDNYGRKQGIRCWEVDHIVPINYNNPSYDEVVKRLHYTNCQPMWADKNRMKSNKYIG